MGARTPANAKEKRSAYSCEECDEHFGNIRSYKLHIQAKHQSNAVVVKQEENHAKSNIVANLAASRVSKRLRLKKEVGKDAGDSQNDNRMDSDGERKSAKGIKYACPKCSKVFDLNIYAEKHIQRQHYEDGKGNPVTGESLALLKPVKMTVCLKCSKPFTSIEHECYISRVIKKLSGIFKCLGCERDFCSIGTFDQHLGRCHRENIDSMFFPEEQIFMKWKADMEAQLRIKYLKLSDTTNMHFYQCNYVSIKNDMQYTHLCPSAIIVRKMQNGHQIYFHKKHFDHVCPEYHTSEDYAHYVTNKTSEIKQTPSKQAISYMQFKNLMKLIVGDAKILDIEHLEQIHNKALDLHNTLKNFLSKKEDEIEKQLHSLMDSDSEDKKENRDTNKSITDDQITQLLETPKESIVKPKGPVIETRKIAMETPRVSARLKRKTEPTTASISPKRIKDSINEDLKQPTVLTPANKFHVASVSIPPSPNTVSKEENSTTNKKLVTTMSPVLQTFNDTYKEFIDKTLKEKPAKDKHASGKSSPILKSLTKDKSVSGKSSPIFKSLTKDKLASGKSSPILKSSVNKQNVIPVSNSQISKSNITERSNKEATKKDDIPIIKPAKKNGLKHKLPINKPQKSKKVIVKTRIGQFTPSPKKNVQVKHDPIEEQEIIKPFRTSLSQVTDFKYKVVEQENDCNILVLKI